jgi:hypothetical protein
VADTDDDDDSSVDVVSSLAGLTVDQLVALEAAGSNPQAIAAAIGESGATVVAAPAAEEDDDGSAPAAVVPAGDAAAGTAGKSSPRISMRGLSDDDAAMTRAAVSAVKEGRFPSVVAALAGLYPDLMPSGAPAPAATPQEAQSAPDAAVVSEPVPMEPSPELIGLRDSLAALDTQIDAANDAWDTLTANKLLRERQDVVRKLDREELRFEQQSQQFAAFEEGVDVSSARAVELFPDLGIEGSAAFSAVEDAIILARAKGDDIFNQSNWPEQIAKRTLERLPGTAAAVQNSATKPEAQVQIPAPLPKGVRMPGSLVGSDAQATQLTAISAAAELEKMDPDEQIRALELADKRLAGR